jgi:hypothetical protein|tara:strand:- start:2004 stop:2924 length:921 start_codon:yes stop_codon:yes gene_type:complete
MPQIAQTSDDKLVIKERRIMKRLVTTITLVFLFAPVTASAQNEEAIQGAKFALENFLEDWNRSDLDAIQKHLSFPHVTHGQGRLIVAQQEGDFAQDFGVLRRQGWRRSSFDSLLPLQASESKVNFLVDFTRYGADNEIISIGQVFYVVTKQADGWGMHYRSGGPPERSIMEGARDSAIQEATIAIYNFFEAFNSADNNALLDYNHVPQAMLNTRFLHAINNETPPVRMNFDGMRENELWSYSILEDLEVVHAMDNKVIFQLEFERFNSLGNKYSQVPAVWVLTKINEKWGVQYRSLMPAVGSQIMI